MPTLLKRLLRAIDESGATPDQLKRAGLSQQNHNAWQHDPQTKPKADTVARLVHDLNLNGHYILTGERGPSGEADYQAGVRAACRIYEDLCKTISGVAAERRLDARLEEIHRDLMAFRHRPPNGGHRHSGGG